MRIKALLTSMVLVLLAGCTSLSGGSWVAVAAYPNPISDRDGERAEDALTSVLSKNGIRAMSFGSREWVLCVSQASAERARTLTAKTIEDQRLKARVVQ